MLAFDLTAAPFFQAQWVLAPTRLKRAPVDGLYWLQLIVELLIKHFLINPFFFRAMAQAAGAGFNESTTGRAIKMRVCHHLGEQFASFPVPFGNQTPGLVELRNAVGLQVVDHFGSLRNLNHCRPPIELHSTRRALAEDSDNGLEGAVTQVPVSIFFQAATCRSQIHPGIHIMVRANNKHFSCWPGRLQLFDPSGCDAFGGDDGEGKRMRLLAFRPTALFPVDTEALEPTRTTLDFLL